MISISPCAQVRTNCSRTAARVIVVLLSASPACLTGSYKPAETATDTATATDAGTTGVTTAPTSVNTTHSDNESTSTLGGAVCGDMVVDGGEECDDGNRTPGDGCENDCTLTPPNCGDGKVDPEEVCDDANTDNTDACVACKLATCGDNVVWVGQEVCDDGQDNGMYNGPCATDCQGPGPFCGDMMTNGPEQCDDGQVGSQDDGQDDCSNDCLTSRYVFVTDAIYDGHFEGGITGADEVCATLGTTVKTNTTWKAWLSIAADIQTGTEEVSPASRMDTSFKGYYQLPTKVPVAKGWPDLIDGSLLNPINVTANMLNVALNESVWTNTAQNGMAKGTNDCTKWSSGLINSQGRYGNVAEDPSWTDSADTICKSVLRIYCFED